MGDLGTTRRTGEILGCRFLLGDLVGTGGMARVFSASDVETGKRAVVKVMGPTMTSSLPRFEREADVLAALDHPNIVKYQGHGRTRDDRFYLAMEWVDGETLAARLRRERLTPSEALTVGVSLAKALDAIHRLGVVHRDLKPSNIMLGPDGKVTLLDFGVAMLEGSALGLTQTGMVVGTPGYLSPEQARGVTVDRRADIFSLGCVLFACLTGHAPFRGSDLLAVLAKIVFQPTPSVRSLRSDVRPDLNDLVHRFMAKSPDDRPRDAQEAIEVLLDAQRQTSVSTAASSTPSLMGISSAESLLCAIVVVASPTQSSAMTAVTEIASRMGGQLETFANGARVIRWLDSAGATERAAIAGGAAVELAELHPDQPVALTTVRGTRGSEDVVVTAIDRATALIGGSAAIHGRERAAVRVDDTTAAFLDAYFTFRRVDGHLEIVAERDPGDEDRKLLGIASPCIGRERELALLDATLAQVLDDTAPRAVLVTGEPGVGKTRLWQEWLRGARKRRDAQVWIGAGAPWGARAPFGVLGQALRRSMGIQDDDAHGVRAAKVRARVGSALSMDPPLDVERHVAFMCELLGAPLDDEQEPLLQAARRDRTLMADQLRRTVIEFCRREAASGPLIVVLEDAQWCDVPSLRLIDSLLAVEEDLPLMVFALARGALLDEIPRLWADRRAQRIQLEPLSRRSSECLARQALGTTVANDAIVRIVELGNGNPFFLEELVRQTASGGMEHLPDTVLAVIEARLAKLEPEARRVLRAASAFGDSFWKGGLVAILGDLEEESLTSILADLERIELIERRHSMRFSDDDEYGFRHPLLCEAVYATFVDADRRVAHAAAARWLAAMGENEANILASHYEAAHATEEAAICYSKAGDRALAASEFDLAQVLARKSLSLSPRGPRSTQSWLLIAEATRWQDEQHASLAAADAAAHAAPPGTESAHRALLLAVTAATRLGGQVDVRPRLATALEAAEASRGSHSGWELASGLGVAAILAGDFPIAERVASLLTDGWKEAEQDVSRKAAATTFLAYQADAESDAWGQSHYFDRAADLYASLDNERQELLMRCNGAFVRSLIGQFAQARTGIEAVLERARRSANARVIGTALASLGSVSIWQGRFDEADALADQALHHASARGDQRFQAAVHGMRSRARLAMGDAEGALVEAQRATAMAPPRTETAHVAQGAKAMALLRLGRSEAALVATGGAVAALDEGRLRATAFDPFLRLCHADVLYALGRVEDADRALSGARHRLAVIAMRLPRELRRTYLTARTEHARILALWHTRRGDP